MTKHTIHMTEVVYLVRQELMHYFDSPKGAEIFSLESCGVYSILQKLGLHFDSSEDTNTSLVQAEEKHEVMLPYDGRYSFR